MNPKRYRFVVQSAEEAVKLIHERLGEKARVIAVRQVEGKGLARFLSSPKLEVTAEVSDEEPAPAAPTAAPPRAAEEQPVSEPAPAAPEPMPPAAAAKRIAAEPEPAEEDSRLVRLLRAAGISGTVLARLRADDRWAEIDALPAGRGLARVSGLLAAQLRELPRHPLGNRIVFLGNPGAGKTTALCKLLATEVFLRQQRATVLKLDLDCANPGDGLSVFCDAMGVPCVRTVEDVADLDPETQLYVDLPGLCLEVSEQIERLAEELTPVAATSHVLVVNAAYDAAIIKHLCHIGEQIGCTHLVLTHCDELIHWGKLLDVLLGSQLTPLFLSLGQNVAGDIEENVAGSILARTFPALGKEAAQEAVAS